MDPIKEFLQQMQEKLDAAKKAESGEEAARLMEEFDDLKARKEAMERAIEAEKAIAVKSHDEAEVKPQGKESSYDKAVKQMARAARQSFSGLKEGTDSEGGYIVPEDILTRIEHLREAEFSLIDLVTVKNVKTDKGERTFRNRSTVDTFSSVSEAGKIPVKSTPTFKRLPYSIEKYAGIYAVTDEVLADTDQNLVGELIDWIAMASRNTRNAIILATLNEKYTRQTNPETAKEIASLDDLKHILTVDLGQAFKNTSVVVTNDSGLDWLDTLKDKNDRYLLKRDTQDPLALYIEAGATRVRLVVVPNAILPNEQGGAPVYIGDLKEGIVFWNRRGMSIKASDTAAVDSMNAFQEDLTLYRAIEREDCTVRDDMAFYKGYITAVEPDEDSDSDSGNDSNAG